MAEIPRPRLSEKEEAEVVKLRAEARNLNRRWWQRHEFYNGLAPIFVAGITAVVGIYLTVNSRIFEVKESETNARVERLKAEEIRLEIKVGQFQERSASLSNQVDTLIFQVAGSKDERRDLTNQIFQLVETRDSISNELQKLRIERKGLTNAVAGLIYLAQTYTQDKVTLSQQAHQLSVSNQVLMEKREKEFLAEKSKLEMELAKCLGLTPPPKLH